MNDLRVHDRRRRLQRKKLSLIPGRRNTAGLKTKWGPCVQKGSLTEASDLPMQTLCQQRQIPLENSVSDKRNIRVRVVKVCLWQLVFRRTRKYQLGVVAGINVIQVSSVKIGASMVKA